MKPCVSVIIPVYNAADFLEEAVNSVLGQTCVGELILVDDGSTDGSIELCEKLADSNSKVLFFYHKEHRNLGASSTRNLGVTKANFEFISFLDADDYFLPNRFDFFEKYLIEGKKFDGIYEPVQYFNGSDKIYGVSKNIKPNKLFHYLIRGTYGHFHTNGLIVKRELLIKAGLFDISLALHQDSDLWLKLAFYGKLIPGSLTEPVARVRLHDGNRIWKGTNAASRYKQLKVTWEWARNERIGFLNKILLYRKFLKFKMLSKNDRL